MSIDIKETNQRIRQIADQVRHFGVLIGPKDSGEYVPGLSCAPGLGMNAEADALLSVSEDLQQGLFKILVMGKFKNGKSTLINALLGRSLMPARATATTAVITVVEYGSRTDRVKVYRNNSRAAEEISLEEYAQRFALTAEDMNQIEEDGCCDRFSDIDKVVMESDDNLFRNGVQLIDSPGLEEARARSRTTSEYVPKAHAIIFLLSATSLFSAAERKWIAKYFAGKQLRNVFFVVNRTDNLGPGQLQTTVKPAVREGLREVFLREDGSFNEELYQKRVFYTNAYGALCARTGTPYILQIGDRALRVDLTPDETGLPAFEQALTDFLNSEDRLAALFQSMLYSMAETFADAKLRIHMLQKARALPLEELEVNLQASSEILRMLRADAQSLRHMIQHQGRNIAKRVYLSLLDYVQREIPREFEAAIEQNDAKFGVAEMLSLAASALTSNLPWNDPEAARQKQETLLKPITDKINQYIFDQLEVWQSRICTEISPNLRDLEEELDEGIHRFDLQLQQAVAVFSGGNGEIRNMYSANPLQTILALTNGDLSLVVEGAALGGMSWSDYFKKTVVQAVLNWTIGALFGAAILIPALIVEVAGLLISSQRLPRQLLQQLGPIAFSNLKSRVESQEEKLTHEVEEQFISQSDDLFFKANGLIEEELTRQVSILEEKKASEQTSQDERMREEKVLASVEQAFSRVYELVYGMKPRSHEIEMYADRKGI